MIQHRAACYVLGWEKNSRDSITAMLSSLRWPSLQLRIKWATLILLFKVLHGFLVISPEYLPVLSMTKMRANHDFKFLHYHTSVDYYKTEVLLLPRTAPEWNSLPS